MCIKAGSGDAAAATIFRGDKSRRGYSCIGRSRRLRYRMKFGKFDKFVIQDLLVFASPEQLKEAGV